MHRRAFVRSALLSLAAPPLIELSSRSSLGAAAPSTAARPRPTAAQLRWQRDELAMFVHFGVNTFTDREWGDGHEDPAVFAPTALDARQWARAARASGFRAMILTAKHHDGFCLWPTATTQHSVARSGWRNGQGDVVREFVDACRAEGLRPGLYLSPWDRNNATYGDSPRYNDLYVEQLTELLTRYGPLAEIWFDGANGEGPNGRKQLYDWPRFWGVVRRLQPNAVIFSDAGPDVRWCGNESGQAGDPNWSTVDPSIVTVPGATGDAVIPSLQHGDPNGGVWRPAEADVSIRPGWFYHASEDARVRSADNLTALYFSSVGRNSKLLLNVPPTRAGLLHETDVARLRDFRDARSALFAEDVARHARVRRLGTGAQSATLEVDLVRATSVGVARIQEGIARGQSVSAFALSALVNGSWTPLAEGSTIGYARLVRFPQVVATRVRLTTTFEHAPSAVSIQLFS